MKPKQFGKMLPIAKSWEYKTETIRRYETLKEN